jgi:hypothetical protein
MPSSSPPSNNNSSRKSQEPTRDVRKLQMMTEIERLIVQGKSHNDIMGWLNLPRSTYFKYLKSLFKADRQMLQAKRVEDVETSYAILLRRLQLLYEDARKIIDSESTSDEDRLVAMNFAATAAISITKVTRESAVALFTDTPPKDRKRYLVLGKDEHGKVVDASPLPSSDDDDEQEEPAAPRKKPGLFVPSPRLDNVELQQKAKEVRRYQEQQEEEDDDEGAAEEEDD